MSFAALAFNVVLEVLDLPGVGLTEQCMGTASDALYLGIYLYWQIKNTEVSTPEWYMYTGTATYTLMTALETINCAADTQGFPLPDYFDLIIAGSAVIPILGMGATGALSFMNGGSW